MSLFDPPYDVLYRCRKCKVKISETRNTLTPKDRKCPKCNKTMFETRAVHVGLKTDTAFMSGSNDGFGNDNTSRQIALKRAEAAGVSVAGKRFCPGLVDTQGDDQFDPNAWISSKSEAKKRCEEKGWKSDELGVKPRLDEPDGKPYRVCDELVSEEIEERLGDQTVSGKEMADLRETVTNELSGE